MSQSHLLPQVCLTSHLCILHLQTFVIQNGPRTEEQEEDNVNEAQWGNGKDARRWLNKVVCSQPPLTLTQAWKLCCRSFKEHVYMAKQLQANLVLPRWPKYRVVRFKARRGLRSVGAVFSGPSNQSGEPVWSEGKVNVDRPSATCPLWMLVSALRCCGRGEKSWNED